MDADDLVCEQPMDAHDLVVTEAVVQQMAQLAEADEHEGDARHGATSAAAAATGTLALLEGDPTGEVDIDFTNEGGEGGEGGKGDGGEGGEGGNARDDEDDSEGLGDSEDDLDDPPPPPELKLISSLAESITDSLPPPPPTLASLISACSMEDPIEDNSLLDETLRRIGGSGGGVGSGVGGRAGGSGGRTGQGDDECEGKEQGGGGVGGGGSGGGEVALLIQSAAAPPSHPTNPGSPPPPPPPPELRWGGSSEQRKKAVKREGETYAEERRQLRRARWQAQEEKKKRETKKKATSLFCLRSPCCACCADDDDKGSKNAAQMRARQRTTCVKPSRRECLKFLDLMFDCVTMVLSVADVVTDVIVAIEFYNLGAKGLPFLVISLTIVALAQLCYIVLFVIHYGRGGAWGLLPFYKRAAIVACLLPTAQFVPIFLWAQSLKCCRTGDRVLTWMGLVPDDKRSGAAIRAANAERAEERRRAQGGLPAIPVADDDAELKEYVCVESFTFMLARWGLYVGGGPSLPFRSLIHVVPPCDTPMIHL